MEPETTEVLHPSQCVDPFKTGVKASSLCSTSEPLGILLAFFLKPML